MAAKYDQHYATSDRACGEPFPLIVEVAEQTPPTRVLDLGCGQGRDAIAFARQGHEVVGVDVSAVGIDQLRAIATSEGLAIRAQVGDIVRYDPKGAFGIVILDRVLHMLPDDASRRTVLDKACSALAPDGQLLVSEYPRHRELVRAAIGGRPGWRLERDEGGFLFARREAPAR